MMCTSLFSLTLCSVTDKMRSNFTKYYVSGSDVRMDRNFTTSTTYFLQEGRENLDETLAIAFRAAKQHNIRKVVIFTAEGEGVRIAVENYLPLPEYQYIALVAVTFPQGKGFTNAGKEPIDVDISSENQKLFAARGIPLVRGHLPFDPIAPHFKNRGVLGQDLSLIGDALDMFCGSMSLCVQAVLLACDAREVDIGEHVIAMTSDTSILAQATCTRKMLSEFVIREILCKPAILNIGRKERVEHFLEASTGAVSSEALVEKNPSPESSSPKEED
jgi:uncharacterized protein